MTPRTIRTALAAPLAALPLALAASPTLHPNPAQPAYGEAVGIEVRNLDWPAYLPATRFTKKGNRIVIDYEYASDPFGPTRPDFGLLPVPMGELTPGTYQVEGRFTDLRNPQAPPQTASAHVQVAPPADWGLFPVPRDPDGHAPFDVVVNSAAYFDPATLRATVSGGVVRVDFDFEPSAPVMSGPAPAGLVPYASVRVASLPPGSYRLEGWGRPKSGGEPQRYFAVPLAVRPAVSVVEYYAESLDHYFMAAGPDEVAALDSGASPGWKRTGQRFKAWLLEGDAPAGTRPVCRFYASGPNSHFYTGDAAECEGLKALESRGRAEAQARGRAFTGWQYEGIAFHALMPQAGQCPAGSAPVYRAYNNRAQVDDSNHRFMAEPRLRAAMAMSWTDEGIAFCSPQ